jgi:hypothetical protein
MELPFLFSLREVLALLSEDRKRFDLQSTEIVDKLTKRVVLWRDGGEGNTGTRAKQRVTSHHTLSCRLALAQEVDK